MKSLVCLPILLGASVFLAGCSEEFWNGFSFSRVIQTDGYRFDFRGETASREESGDISPDVTEVEVDHRFGNVRVLASDEDLKWSWKVTCWADDAATASRHTDDVNMSVDHQDGRVSWTLVLPEPPVGDLRGVESELTLFVPESVSAKLKNRHGEAEVRGIQQGVVATCEHSTLRLANLGGSIEASTTHGELSAEQIPGGRLQNRHGKLIAKGVTGDLEAKTAFGELSVEEVTGNLLASNEHGQVTIHGIGGAVQVSNRHGRVSLETAQGPATIENEHGHVSASNVSEGVEIRTTHAHIEIEDIVGDLALQNHHGNIRAVRAEGKLRAETAHGNIEIEGSAEDVECRNEHGRIRMNLTGPLRRLHAETSFSNIELSLSSSLVPRIQARTTYGNVRSEFPVFQAETGTDNFADLDADTPQVTLTNHHGDITVTKAVVGETQL